MNPARMLVESLVAAFRNGDVAHIRASVAADCAWRGSLAPELPYAGVRKGPNGVSQYFESMFTALVPDTLTIENWVCEGETVVAIGSWAGAARRSGKRFDTPLALYFRVRDGKVTEFRGFEDSALTVAALHA